MYNNLDYYYFSNKKSTTNLLVTKTVSKDVIFLKTNQCFSPLKKTLPSARGITWIPRRLYLIVANVKTIIVKT